MKASKLIQDLARQIADYGDLDVVVAVSLNRPIDSRIEYDSIVIKGCMLHDNEEIIEIYGEEK